MTDQKDNLAEDLIISKMKTLTEDIYIAIKELPCDQFGTVMSMLITGVNATISMPSCM